LTEDEEGAHEEGEEGVTVNLVLGALSILAGLNAKHGAMRKVVRRVPHVDGNRIRLTQMELELVRYLTR
jgi:hypothetical protein